MSCRFEFRLRNYLAASRSREVIGILALSLVGTMPVADAHGQESVRNPNSGAMKGIRDEKTFTDAEFAEAFSFVLPLDEARRVAKDLNQLPDLKGFESASSEELLAAPVKSPRSYDGDTLDLLSLVSEDCAERAWKLLGVSTASGRERRKEFVKRISGILLRQPGVNLN